MWGSRSASALLRALSPGGRPGRLTWRVPSASEQEATGEKIVQLSAPGACGSRSRRASARRGGSWGPRLRLWYARAPGAFGTLSGAPAGHSPRGAFPLLFLPLWCRSARHASGGCQRRRAGAVPSGRLCLPAPHPVPRVRVPSVVPSLKLVPSLRLSPLLVLEPPLGLGPSLRPAPPLGVVWGVTDETSGHVGEGEQGWDQ